MDDPAEAAGRPSSPTRPGAGWVEAVIWLASLLAERDVGSLSEDPDYGFFTTSLRKNASASHAEGDRWIVLIWKRTLEDARAAAKVALTSASCAPMFALIDDQSMLMVDGELAVPRVHRRGSYVMSGLRARTIADAACS